MGPTPVRRERSRKGRRASEEERSNEEDRRIFLLYCMALFFQDMGH